MRLLVRTTRRVAPTEAGERLLRTLGPALDDIATELASIGELRDKPAGNIRITTSEHAAHSILWPWMSGWRRLPASTRTRHRFRLLRHRRGPLRRRGQAWRVDRQGHGRDADWPGSAHGGRGRPVLFRRAEEARTPHDLAEHRCLNLRLSTSGGVYAWEFEKDGRELKVRVDGQFTFNNARMIVRACLDGFGLCSMPEDIVSEYLADGRLVRVLKEWCPPFSGYHLYYPNRRQPSAAFALLVEALRYRGWIRPAHRESQPSELASLAPRDRRHSAQNGRPEESVSNACSRSANRRTRSAWSARDCAISDRYACTAAKRF